jgi:hypothetical protein
MYSSSSVVLPSNCVDYLQSTAMSRRQLLESTDDSNLAVSAAAKDLDQKSQQLIDCLQRPVIRKGLRKSATQRQKAAAGVAIAKCFVDNLNAFVPPKAQAAEDETVEAAAARVSYQSLSAVINALLPAQLIVNTVAQLVKAKVSLSTIRASGGQHHALVEKHEAAASWAGSPKTGRRRQLQGTGSPVLMVSDHIICGSLAVGGPLL